MRIVMIDHQDRRPIRTDTVNVISREVTRSPVTLII